MNALIEEGIILTPHEEGLDALRLQLRNLFSSIFTFGLPIEARKTIENDLRGLLYLIERMGNFADLEEIWKDLRKIQSYIESIAPKDGRDIRITVLKHKPEASQQAIIRFFTKYLSNLWDCTQKITEKVSKIPELKTRWDKTLTEVGGNIGTLLYSFEHLINDEGFDWKQGRKTLDDTIISIGKMEVFVEEYLKLKDQKSQELKYKEQQKEKMRKYASRFREILFRKDPSGNIILEKETIDARMKKIIEFSAAIVPDSQSEGENLSSYENKINHDMPSLEHMERIGKIVEEILLQPPKRYDAAWILKSIARLSDTGGNDEFLRQEVESALYALRKKSVPLDLSNIDGRTDQEIKVLTTKGVRIISPGFIEHKNYLFGKTFHNGKWVRCRCNSDSFKVGMSSFIEVFDGERGLQKVEYIPLACKRVDRKKPIISPLPEDEAPNIKTSETIEKPSIAPLISSPSVTIDPKVKGQIAHVPRVRQPFTESANVDNTPGEPLTTLAPPPDTPREQKPSKENGFLSLVKNTGRDFSKKVSNWWHKAA